MALTQMLLHRMCLGSVTNLAGCQWQHPGELPSARMSQPHSEILWFAGILAVITNLMVSLTHCESPSGKHGKHDAPGRIDSMLSGDCREGQCT